MKRLMKFRFSFRTQKLLCRKSDHPLFICFLDIPKLYASLLQVIAIKILKKTSNFFKFKRNQRTGNLKMKEPILNSSVCGARGARRCSTSSFEEKSNELESSAIDWQFPLKTFQSVLTLPNLDDPWKKFNQKLVSGSSAKSLPPTASLMLGRSENGRKKCKNARNMGPKAHISLTPFRPFTSSMRFPM